EKTADGQRPPTARSSQDERSQASEPCQAREAHLWLPRIFDITKTSSSSKTRRCGGDSRRSPTLSSVAPKSPLGQSSPTWDCSPTPGSRAAAFRVRIG